MAFIQLGYPDLAIKVIGKSINPRLFKGTGENLNFVLELGKSAHKIDCKVIVTGICGRIVHEAKYWNRLSISKGFNPFDPDSISIFMLVVGTIIINTLERSSVIIAEYSAKCLLEPFNVLINDMAAFQDIPKPVKMLAALHYYCAALAFIAKDNLSSVQSELARRKKPIEQVVICLALAQNGDFSIVKNLKQLCHNSNWLVRLFAYESLIVLGEVLAKPLSPTLLIGLQDKDIRVKVPIASVMASTGNSGYHSHILALADSTDKKCRQSILPVIAWLAKRGNQTAQSKLVALARGDSNERVRETAQDYLVNQR